MTLSAQFGFRAPPGMPPLQSRAMPTQDLRVAPIAQRRQPTPRRVQSARVIVFGGTAALAAFGAYEMISVVSAGGITQFEALFTALFVLNFTWIALAAASAIAGVVVRPRDAPAVTMPRLTTRTALVMPVYHENVAATAAALEVMSRGIATLCQAHAFEIVVLSNSTSADSWVAETHAVDELRRAVGGTMPVWYRRRWKNTAKKAGNVRDFIEHWGARYDHFVVLDADSLIAPETLVALATRMERDRELALLQTAPALAGGETLFGRLQQFANRIYGPIVTRGLAAWSGSDNNYWGHNAIVRTEAFAACCGLPGLPGKPPFGGAIMSHDFVEAALLVRAGWRVEMAPDLPGSWEGSPPSLLDTAARDRRWAQGNLQHTRVLTARGLAWPSRVHLAVGIMSYLASPLWLLLIACGIVLTVQADLIRPEYFPDPHQLFPRWPLFDSERMVRLFLFTVGVLLLPKVLGLLLALASRDSRHGAGGALRLIASSVLEIVLTALYAPVMMAIHVRHVADIMLGRDGGWAAQRRGGETTWRDAWRRHSSHMALGIVAAVGAWIVLPPLIPWLAPMFAGLFLAVPLSYASGSGRFGAALRRAGLLLTPEETAPHPILAAREAAIARYATAEGDVVRLLAGDEIARERHLRWANPNARRRGAPDPAFLTAAAKITEASTRDEAIAWFTSAERVQVAGDRGLIEAIAALPVAGTLTVSPQSEAAKAEQARVPALAEAGLGTAHSIKGSAAA